MKTGSVSSLREQIARATTLSEALRALSATDGAPCGILRIIAGRVSGRLAIKDGRIVVGALITASGQTGEPALEKLLLVVVGVFQFREGDSQGELFDQGLCTDISSFPCVDEQLSLKEGNGEAACPVALPEPGAVEIFASGMESGQGLSIEAVPSREADQPFDLAPAQPSLTLSKNEDSRGVLAEAPCLTDEQMKLLDLYGKLASEQDREAFLAENPEFGSMMSEQSLSAEQLRLMELYKRLNSDQDRQDFLEGNPGFSDVMSDAGMSAERLAVMENLRSANVDKTIQEFLGFQKLAPGVEASVLGEEQLAALRSLYADLATESERQAFLAEYPSFGELMSEQALSEEQKQVLAEARQGAVMADMAAFLEFQNQMLGADHAPLNEQQLEMLRQMYREMAGEANRQAFLAENPILSEDIPVLRGGGIRLPQAEPEAPVDEEAEAARLKAQLDAINIVPVDMPTRAAGEEGQEPVYHEQIGLEKPKKKKKFLEKYGRWIAVFVVTGVCGCLLVVYWSRKVEPPAPVIPVLEEKDVDLLGEHLDDSLQAEIPQTIRSRPSPGGGSSGNGGAPSYGSGESGYRSVGDEMQAADRLLSEGKLPQAIAVFASCVQTNPDYIPARIALIKAYILAKDNRKARLIAIAGLKRARTKEDKLALQALLSSVLGDQGQGPAAAKPGKPAG